MERTVTLMVCLWIGMHSLTFAESADHDQEASHGDKCQHCEQHACYHCVSTDPGHPAKPKRDKPGDIDRGDCPRKRYGMCDFERAGRPECVAPWAKCSITKKYSAWFVGGGAAYAHLPQSRVAMFGRGRNRKANGYNQHGEGTWGMDYGGLFGKANIWLKYTCGRDQGGEGAYETDGEPEFVAKLKSRFGHGHE